MLLLLSASAVLGIVDTTLIHQEIAQHKAIVCFVFTGCDAVLLSSYNTLFGVSLSLLGIAFYVGLGGMLLAYVLTRYKLLETLYGIGLAGGIAFSFYLFYVQAFVLHSFCSYCLLSLINLVVAGGLYVSWKTMGRRLLL